MWALLRVASDDNETVHVPTAAIAQAWRDGRRQALLAKALKHCNECPLDGPTARAAGLLCTSTNTTDIVDASIVVTAAASKGERTILYTSDPADITKLANATASNIDIRSI